VTSQDDAFQQAAALHQAGRLEEAGQLYRSILQVQPSHPEANHNLGMVAIQSKRPDAALPHFEAAIEANPDQGRFRLSYVYALLQAGQPDAARQALARGLHLDLNREAVAALTGELANHVGDESLSGRDALLAALFSEGRFAEAAAVAEEMTTRFPLYVEAHLNLCIALKQLHRLAEAEASCRRALALKPDFAEAHGVLGSVFHALGRRDAAGASFRRAIELEADPAEAHDKVASLLIAAGDLPAALNFVLQSLRIRETEHARRNFVFCVRRLTFAKNDDSVRAMLLRALTGPWARPRALAAVAINFVKLNPVVQACMAPQPPFGNEVAAALAADLLLCALLNSTPVCDVDLERFLTFARRTLLDEAAAAPGAAGGCGPALDFYSALANQCFINEYVFGHAGDEGRKAGELRDALQAALEAGAPVPPLLVLAVAAYFPLGSLPLAPRLLEAQWPGAISAVLTQQIREPREELQLRAGIARLTAIDGEISLRVQSQYEENPYPRWIRPAPAGEAMDFDAFLRRRFPQAFFHRGGLPEDAGRGGIDILIAGCGTGQQSIETSRKFAGARVLAVDLSMNSLGYAKRKTGELGLTAIEYAQADLLRLGSLDRRFDLIESVGVLHHLADPWAGWRVLVSLLRPGGIMRIGLYSELARRHIVRARAFIAEKGYGSTADEIRRCRQDLLGSEAGGELRTVAAWADFFSTSACRDLLFHVQEHRMDLARIGEFIGANGLQFLGFDIEDEVRHAYRRRFPRDFAAVDLNLWQQFESGNPDTFIGMYQFWVQKES
jgi:Flp pilus assembly protein TadD/2-polyprenyl-3-methyl-5-hydroxy-6-metoxy-1,4-benzoquinol methylase